KLEIVSGPRSRRQPQDKRGENEVDDRDDCGGPDEPVGRLQKGVVVSFTGADPHGALNRRHEDLAVAGWALASGVARKRVPIATPTAPSARAATKPRASAIPPAAR